jgi:hypothetical protein
MYLDPEYQSTHYNLFKDSITVPLKSVLPPEVSRDAFVKAIGRYKAVVGDAQVYEGDALTEYIDPYELHEAEGTRRMPSAAVRPKTVEELREVLKISNEFGIPVWTFSRGKNLGLVNPSRYPSYHALDFLTMEQIWWSSSSRHRLCGSRSSSHGQDH